MITTLIICTLFIMLGLLSISLVQSVVVVKQAKLDRTLAQRFWQFPTHLYVTKNESGESEYSEDIRRLMGEDVEDKEAVVTTRLTVDLEQVQFYEEWTTGYGQDGKMIADSTMLTLYSGDRVFILVTFAEFDDLFINYQESKYLV